MKRFICYLFSFLCVILIFSCATSEISIIKNEEKRILDCKQIVVFSNTQDISFRKNLESELKENFLLHNKNAIESITLIPPLKEYSISEIYEICKQNNCDSILSVSQMTAEKETGYIVCYGTLLPTSAVLSNFDVQLIDLNDGKTVLKATVNSEGDTLNAISKSISKKIVSEILSKEGEEFIPIVKNLLESELHLKQLSKTNYSIIGKSQIGRLVINANSVDFILPLSFHSINDSKKLIEIVNSEPKYCKISTNNVDNLPYIIDLLKVFNNSGK